MEPTPPQSQLPVSKPEQGDGEGAKTAAVIAGAIFAYCELLAAADVQAVRLGRPIDPEIRMGPPRRSRSPRPEMGGEERVRMRVRTAPILGRGAEPGIAAGMETTMKLHVTVDGKTYDVEVEPAGNNVPASAASRVEGLPVGGTLPRPPLAVRLPRPNTLAGAQGAAAPIDDAPRRAPTPKGHWNRLTTGEEGECVSPVPGIVKAILVKLGDNLKANEPLVEIEVSHIVATSEKPLIGTIRALQPGTVSEIRVAPGQNVDVGDVLLKLTRPT